MADQLQFYPFITAFTIVFLLVEVICTAPSSTERSATTAFVEVPVGKVPRDRDAWSRFLSDNLDPDLAYWRARAPLAAAHILTAHNKTLEVMNIPAVIQLALIYNNTLYWPGRPDPNGGEPTRSWASSFVIHFHRWLAPALSSGRLTLPNVLFIYNTDDNAPRFNAPSRKLPVPLLSLIKSQGLPGGDDLDVLVPQMFMVHSSMFSVPWHLKLDRAYFRGIGFCSGRWAQRYGYVDACPRTYLSHLAHRDQQAGNGTALDVGLVERFKFRVMRDGPDVSIKYDLPVLDRVPFTRHAFYKWVLHMEGITASSRLGQLFHTNSLVLMQRSPFLEYFYRSLRPWHHYVPFWNATREDGTALGMDDVYDTLERLRRLDREDPLEVQQMVARGNQFALSFLTPHARLLYYREALLRYKQLFPDMDRFLESYVQGLRDKGWSIP